MVTTDFSPAAEPAISAARKLAGVREAGVSEILLVHVIGKEKDFDEAAKKLNLLREELAGAGRKITVHVLQGRRPRRFWPWLKSMAHR